MLKLKFTLLIAGLVLIATAAGAQTKITGTLQCGKPDSQNATPVNDHSGHALVVAKDKCTWTKSMEIAGVQTKTGEDTAYSDADGSKSRDSGYHVSTMANGDTFVVRFSGASTLDKNGAPVTQSGTWSFVRGTGKMKGITGKGTYKAKGDGAGGATTEVEGEYQIAGK